MSHLHTHEPHHHSAEPPPPPPDDPVARRRWEFERRWTGRLEVYIAVILGLSAIVAAFAAYRNELFALVEVILATALFLFGIAGVTRRFSIRLGTALGGTAIFLTALIFFATA